MIKRYEEVHAHLLQYDPNRLLDALREQLDVTSDVALARLLEIPPPVLSKIRHNKLAVGASVLLRMHDLTGISIRDLRYLMGDRRPKFYTPVIDEKRKNIDADDAEFA